MAEGQWREKSPKMEQRKVQGPEWKPQVKQTALLASPIYIGQVQVMRKKNILKETKLGLVLLFSLRLRTVGLPSGLKYVFSLLSK